MDVGRDMIAAKIDRLVPERCRRTVQDMLDRCSGELAGPIRTRFQLAALKLYEEGGCGGLDRLMAIASQDRRDVLAWAENPGLMRAPTRLSEARRSRLRARDRRQYLDWLNSD